MEKITPPAFVTDAVVGSSTFGSYIAKSAFYLYPTKLDQTTIYLEGTLNGTEKRIFEVVSTAAINANNRYIITVNLDVVEGDVEITVDVADYDEDINVNLDANPAQEAGVGRVGNIIPVFPTGTGIANGDTYYVTGTAEATFNVTITSTAGTIATAKTLLGNCPATIAANAPQETVTYGGLKVEQKYTITVPEAAVTAGNYNVEMKFTSKNDDTKSTVIRIVRMDAPKAVAGILAVRPGNILTLGGEADATPLFFKYGSLIGIDATKPVGDAFDDGDILYRPAGFPYTPITAWADVPFASTGDIQANDLVAGTGDPCQLIPDYKMPEGNPYKGDITGLSAAAAWGQHADGIFGRTTTTDIFYPAASYRHTSGVVYNVGRTGYYWNSTHNATSAYHLCLDGAVVNVNAGNARSSGFFVRCVPAS